jgi:hypothetical protein
MPQLLEQLGHQQVRFLLELLEPLEPLELLALQELPQLLPRELDNKISTQFIVL